MNVAASDADGPAAPTVDTPPAVAPDTPDEPVRADLATIEREFDGVEAALARLDDGTYWTDEVTGGPIPDATLAADPVARQAAPPVS